MKIPTQLCGDYFINHLIRIPYQTTRIQWTVGGFFWPCQVFIETPDGSGNQLQGTPAGVAGKRNEPERFYTVCQRFPLESFHPKRSKLIIQDIWKKQTSTYAVDNMIRWYFR